MLAHNSIDYINMNDDTEEKIKGWPTCPDFQAT